MTDPGEITYRELADLLRTQIATGQLGPGDQLPSETELTRRHNVGRELVRRAMRLLRSEGLVEPVRGQGLRVRPSRDKQQVKLPRGARGDWRMPTPQERAQLDIGEGVPVLAVAYGGRTDVYPGDRYFFTAA